MHRVRGLHGKPFRVWRELRVQAFAFFERGEMGSGILRYRSRAQGSDRCLPLLFFLVR